MRAIMIGVLSAAFWLQSAAITRADQSATPNKNSAYVSASSISLVTSGYNQVATVGIVKGKKRKVVEVEVTIENKSFTTAPTMSAFARINGLEMEPGAISAPTVICNSAYINCTLSAVFWADLDTLEAAAPGSIIGEPLLIDIMAKSGVNNLPTAIISVRARMLRK